MDVLIDIGLIALFLFMIYEYTPRAIKDVVRAAIAGLLGIIVPAMLALVPHVRAGARVFAQLATWAVVGTTPPWMQPRRVTAPEKPLTPTPTPTAPVMSRLVTDEQTDEQTDQSAAVPMPLAPIALDRSRKAVVKQLVQAGWSTSQIRAVVKGDNGEIGEEIREAKQALGMPVVPPADAPEAFARDDSGKLYRIDTSGNPIRR